MKYKVGDKVKVVGCYYGHCFEIGQVVTIEKVRCDNLDYKVSDGNDYWYVDELEIEPYTPPHQIEVGGKYTSRNGDSWECIAVKGDIAWLNHGTTTAYTFKIDGTPICLGAGSKYTIDLGPKVETITVKGSINGNCVNLMTYHQQMGDHKFTMQVTTLDGKPDWSTAKITPRD
jgi:hypothetical protein